VARTINPETILGAPHVGFTCGALDFSSEPGTDGTLPLFREIVHPESMLFFESPFLPHPRSSRSSSQLTADKPLRSNYLTIGTHML